MVDIALLLPAAYILGVMMTGENHPMLSFIVLIIVLISPRMECTRPMDHVIVHNIGECDLVLRVMWVVKMVMCVCLVLLHR